jgi:hypothetical protein
LVKYSLDTVAFDSIKKMTPARFSLLIAGLIWLSVGLRIGNRAVQWLTPYFEQPSWMLLFLILSVAVGVLKATTVLKKACLRNISNLPKIDERPINYLTGFLILFGVKGSVMISLMIGLGFLLRYLRDLGLDSFNIFGFIYAAIALGLALASRYYFSEFLKVK